MRGLEHRSLRFGRHPAVLLGSRLLRPDLRGEPRCCEVEWDQSCVSIASQLCGTFCNETCREDLDGDNLINGSDLSLLLNAWDTDGCPDLDGNGKVNGADLAILLARWGQSCP